MIKFHVNKAYNYVKGRSLGELALDTFAFTLTIIAFTGLSGVIYNLMFNSPTITFGGW